MKLLMQTSAGTEIRTLPGLLADQVAVLGEVVAEELFGGGLEEPDEAESSQMTDIMQQIAGWLTSVTRIFLVRDGDEEQETPLSWTAANGRMGAVTSYRVLFAKLPDDTAACQVELGWTPHIAVTVIDNAEAEPAESPAEPERRPTDRDYRALGKNALGVPVVRETERDRSNDPVFGAEDVYTTLCMRLGDDDDYTQYEDLEDVADVLFEHSIDRIDRHCKYGVRATDHSGDNYISLYWGDANCEADRDLTDNEIAEVNARLVELQRSSLRDVVIEGEADALRDKLAQEDAD